MVHNQAEFDDTWNGIKNVWIPFYYPKGVYWLMGVCVLLLLLFIKRVNRMLGLITLGLWCGNLCFIYLMFNQFRVHDYYIITLMPALLFLFITVANLMIKSKFGMPFKYATITGLVTLVVIGAVFSRNHQQFRYVAGDGEYGEPPRGWHWRHPGEHHYPRSPLP